MADVNITKVYLLNCPLENDYEHTLWFPSKSAQQSYFQGKIVKSYTDFSYQRKNHVIRVPDLFDNLYQCNYVMYQNSAYSNKWFYAFIVDMKYVDDGRTDITIETDYLQTWLGDYTVKPSFIDREHCKDDTIGKHTVPEQLETGEYVCNGQPINEASLLSRCIVVASTVNLHENEGTFDSERYANAYGTLYNGVYSGIKYYKFVGYTETGVNVLLHKLPKEGKSEAINSIFMAPDRFVDIEDGGYDEETHAYEISASDLAKERKWSKATDLALVEAPIERPSSVDGHKPKNNKLLTFPFSYLYMTNNAGGGCVYQYEYFKHPDSTPEKHLCDFKIAYALTPGGSLKVIPLHYKNVESNYEEGLIGAKFPICAWSTDVYTNWLTQNAVNIAVSPFSGLIGGMTNAGVMGVPAPFAVGGAVADVASTLGEIYQRSFQPPQAEGNLNSGDVTFSSNKLTFSAYRMSVKKEFAEVIDGFFTMYGYKTNLVKVPESNHRENFWYTKTVDANITGHIPNEDMKVIKNAYNKGITFWRANANFRDYSVSNSII